MKKKFFFFSFCCLLLSGCYKNHLYVQQEWIDGTYLASTFVKTPDYRQKNPATGQQIAISWDFPRSQYQEEMTLKLTVRFWDNTQDVCSYLIDNRRGVKTFFFQDEMEKKKRKILTYRIDVVKKNGEILETWKHQFWKNLIQFDKKVPQEDS